MTDQEMEQTIVDNSSLGFPAEEDGEEVRGAEAVASTQNSDATPDAPYAA
jgi:hypothetical protein